MASYKNTLRKITKTEPIQGTGGTMLRETLECGHKTFRRHDRPATQRRRCLDCAKGKTVPTDT